MRVEDPHSGKSYFSKRRRRLDEVGTARSLTFSCFRRFPFLSKDRTRLWFLEAVREARAKFPIDLWAWVLMPDHVHLLVCPREAGKVVGSFSGHVKAQTARQAIDWLQTHAPEWIPRITVVEGTKTRRRFWQLGGGYDRNVEHDRVLLAAIDYLHQNPVRRGLAARATDWEWSSARWYDGAPDCPLEMDRTLPMMYE